MTADDLRKAAGRCRTIAAGLRERAAQVSGANDAAAAANPATKLGAAVTLLCGNDLNNSLRNAAAELDQHAVDLDRAAVDHEQVDAQIALAYRKTHTTGTAIS